MVRSRPVLFFLLLLLAGADAASVAVAAKWVGFGGLPPIPAAGGLHLGLALIAAVAVAFFCRNRKAKNGGTTLAILIFLLALLTPVLGFAVGAWLTSLGSRNNRQKNPRADMRIGNPLHEAAYLGAPGHAPPAQPLLTSLRRGYSPALCAAVPLLRGRFDRAGVGLLRTLREQPDARTQLYAQSALSTLSENREHQIATLRAEAEAHPDSISTREKLAAALLETADSRLRRPAESRLLTEEARDHFTAALKLQPADGACLFGKAQCLLRLGELDELPDLYGRLCALPGESARADRLELSYLAALGNWQRTAETAHRLSRERREAGLDIAQRQFWSDRIPA